MTPPDNVTVEKRVLSWDAVENAIGYTVRLGKEEYTVEENRFSIHSQTADGGKFSIDVMANGDGKKYDDSPWTRIDITLEAVPTTEYDEAGFHYSLLEDKSGYEISRGTNPNLHGVITIPDSFMDYPVKRIAEYAFCLDDDRINCFTEAFCNIVTTGVILPQGLESIGKRAFAFMVRLEEIVIPDSVVTIENQAFNGCTHMTKAVLPKNLKVIPTGCFMNTALDEIVLPETLETIFAGAFKCDFMDPQFGYPILHINSKMSSVVIPDSVKSIGNQTFRGRENLATIAFPEGVEWLDGRCFHETAWYEAQPDGSILLGDILYEYKGEMPENYDLTIPSEVRGIAGQAFKNQKNLRSVVIPEGVRLARENIFSGCENLSEVILPQGLKLIPATSFNGTKSLKSITIPDTVTEMGRAAFASSGLESVTIPSSLKEIPDNAFSGCKSLTSVYISDGVEIIRNSAFDTCYSLSNIRLPSTLKVLEPNFSHSIAEEIIIPKSVETIYSIFSRCENLACVFYEGDATQWGELTRELNFSSQYPPFSSATILFYSEEEPHEEGNFWHYVDGIAVVW